MLYVIYSYCQLEEKVLFAEPELRDPLHSLITPGNADRLPMGSEAWEAEVSRRRNEDAQQIETLYQQLNQRLTTFYSDMRQDYLQQLSTLQQQLLTGRQELVQSYQPREKYRVEIDNKNNALYHLLKRAKDAKATAAAQEAAAEAERLKQEAKMNKGKKK
jgi:uncharacterized phage infection (PIP) family protein YhgE